MEYEQKSVSLSRIDLDDSTYRITTSGETADLIASIQTTGLLNPPFLLGKEKTGKMVFRVVSGFRRIRALVALEREKIDARILGPETSGNDCARLAVTENALQRDLNLIELARCVHLLLPVFGNEEGLSGQARHFNLPKNREMIRKLKLLGNLPLPVQNAVLNETLSLTSAVELSPLNQTELLTFTHIFNHLYTSLNTQKEVITLVREIAKREDIQIGQVLNDPEVESIWNEDNADPRLKTRKLRSYLKKRRFPAIDEFEKRFERHLQSLELGPGMKLSPPAHFEGDTFTLQLSFQKPSHLETFREAIDRLLKNPALGKILK
jgi:ParB/RepB/Spo0J family partition protein